MPMPLFPYGQGPFLRVVNEVMGTMPERMQARVRLDPLSGLDVERLAQDRASFVHSLPRRLSAYDLQHFLNHWLTPSPNGAGTLEFPNIPRDRIMDVLKEGFHRALELAAGPPVLPISVAWICNADPNVFEVVTIVNPNVHAQVLIVTPVPLMHIGSTNVADNVHVTRYFATQQDIDDVLGRLAQLKSQPPNPGDIENPQNAPTGPGQVGTFRVWT